MTETGETRPALLTRAQAGPDLATPPLATCSYREYQRGTGTATAITRMALRGVSLPDPRYTGLDHWPAVKELRPGWPYFKKGLSPAAFSAAYVADLERLGAARIAAALRAVPVEDGRLVLLCYESTADVTQDPRVCHRRIFAQWWEARTGAAVPELRQQADAGVQLTIT